MATVEIARVAELDLEELISSHSLPADTRERVGRSLLTLERFPRGGRSLSGRWRGLRALTGPWGWLIAIYAHEEARDRVTVVAFQDARSAGAASAG